MFAMCHVMWTPQDDEVAKYHQYGMMRFVLSEEYH